VDPRTDLDEVERKKSCPYRDPNRPARSQSLPWLHKILWFYTNNAILHVPVNIYSEYMKIISRTKIFKKGKLGFEAVDVLPPSSVRIVLHWRCGHHILPKHRLQSIRLYGVTSNHSGVLNDVLTSKELQKIVTFSVYNFQCDYWNVSCTMVMPVGSDK
jgi:hypothetical protein